MARLLEKDNRKNTIICAVIFLIGVWYVAWVRLRNIDIMMGPYIFPDQLGYFTHAAVINGLPWYKTTDTWYSYGVSIVLAVIMKFTHNMASIYKIAIYINVLLGELGYVLGCIFVKQISNKMNVKLAMGISAVASCCTAYVFQAQVVWAETYVYTIFMLVLVLALWYAKKPDLLRLFLLTASVCLLFVIHNRTIVVIAALLGYIFLTLFADKRWLRVGLHLFIALVMVLGTYKVNSFIKVNLQAKEGYFDSQSAQNLEWLEANSEILYKEAVTRDIRPDLDGYDRAGQYGNAKIHDIVERDNENNLSGRLFNLSLLLVDSQALFGMIKSFFGAIWYLLASTAGLAAFGIVFLFKKIFYGLQKGSSIEERFKVFSYLFIIMCIVATLVETGYNAMWYPEYTYNTEGAVYWEMLFYGRYVELLTMPLAILGIIDIFEIITKKELIVECVCAYTLQIAASVMVVYESLQLSGPLLNLVCVPGIYGMLEKNVVLSGCVPIILSVVIYVLVKISQTHAIVPLQAASAVVLLAFFYLNTRAVEVYNNDAQISLNGYNELADVLHNNTDVKVIIDSDTVLKDRYYRIRTQAIDNEIVYDAQEYYEDDGDFIYLTNELNVEQFISEHVQDDISLLWYGNYPMIIKGAGLIERLSLEGYEMR